MPNTNFQTFHQMGQAINEVVRQATGRDNVQNIDMEHITVAQNHYYQDVDVSGRVVSFHAGAAGLPLEKCVVQIEPVQEGSGDPAPDNVRPIIGWTGANVYVSPTTDAADGQTYTIAFPAEAGTVYGGTLTVNNDGSGELVVDTEKVVFDGIVNKFISKGARLKNYYANILDGTTLGKTSAGWLTQDELDEAGLISNLIETNASTNDDFYHLGCYIGSSIIMQPRFFLPDCETVEDANAWLVEQTNAGHSLEMCYKLETPNVYNLTAPQITTLLGVNNVWADTGDIEVKFKDLKELY